MNIERDENLIALSAECHTSPRYREFYEWHGDRLHGITGIYDLIRAMSIALTDWERKQTDPWETYDWIALTEYFPQALIAATLDGDDCPTSQASIMRCLESALQKSYMLAPGQRIHIDDEIAAPIRGDR